MYKYLLATTSLLLFSQLSLADTCPSIDYIKHHSLSGWKIHDSEDGTRLSVKRMAKFRQLAEQFVLAEWSNNHSQKNAIHCYYRDKNGSDLEAYLTKDAFIPSANHRYYWYEVSGFLHCAAGMKECEFKHLSQKKLINAKIIS